MRQLELIVISAHGERSRRHNSPTRNYSRLLPVLTRRHVAAYILIRVGLHRSLVRALLVEHLRLDLTVATAVIVWLIGLSVPSRLLSDPVFHVQECHTPLHLIVSLLVSGARLRVQTTAWLRRLS